MNQEMVYDSVGKKIKADLYEGNAVVLFAYGLSGSGKTFTVFGPDAVDIPEVCSPRFVATAVTVRRLRFSRLRPVLLLSLSSCCCCFHSLAVLTAIFCPPVNRANAFKSPGIVWLFPCDSFPSGSSRGWFFIHFRQMCTRETLSLWEIAVGFCVAELTRELISLFPWQYVFEVYPDFSGYVWCFAVVCSKHRRLLARMSANEFGGGRSPVFRQWCLAHVVVFLLAAATRY